MKVKSPLNFQILALVAMVATCVLASNSRAVAEQPSRMVLECNNPFSGFMTLKVMALSDGSMLVREVQSDGQVVITDQPSRNLTNWQTQGLKLSDWAGGYKRELVLRNGRWIVTYDDGEGSGWLSVTCRN